jgi:hypothetical protein
MKKTTTIMFYVKGVGVTGILLVVGLFLFPQYNTEIGIGVLLPWLNTVSGYTYLSKRLYSPDAHATYPALINSGLRLFIMLISFTIVIVLLPVDEFVFIIALFFSYICNSILEKKNLLRLKTNN